MIDVDLFEMNSDMSVWCPACDKVTLVDVDIGENQICDLCQHNFKVAINITFDVIDGEEKSDDEM